MKQAILVILICFFSAGVYGQQNDEKKEAEKKDTKLIRNLDLNSLNLDVKKPDTDVQVQVEVQADEFRGLNITFESIANSLRGYKPYTKQELQAYSDLLTDYHLSDYDRSETARPHKPARLLRVNVPD